MPPLTPPPLTPPNHTFKALVVIFLSLLVLFVVVGLYTFSKKSKVDLTAEVKHDSFANLQANNSSFALGHQEYVNGNYEKSLSLLEESKKLAKTADEKAVIDFNIAASNFEIKRTSGVDDFIALSKNKSYVPRFRALAMVRAYLMYTKFNDITLLEEIASQYKIEWTNESEVTYKYMSIIHGVYPIALSSIMLVNKGLDTAKNRDEALLIYSNYSKEINDSIEETKKNSGEITELTSAMLNEAKLLSRLHIKFDAVSRGAVEQKFEDLVNLDQQVKSEVNKQYALLNYANFETGIKDYKKAEGLITLLLKDSLDQALKEALPKVDIKVRYPYLADLSKNTANPDIKRLISYIGSAIK